MNLDFSFKFGISALTLQSWRKHNLQKECRQRPPITTFLLFAVLRTTIKKLNHGCTQKSDEEKGT